MLIDNMDNNPAWYATPIRIAVVGISLALAYRLLRANMVQINLNGHGYSVAVVIGSCIIVVEVPALEKVDLESLRLEVQKTSEDILRAEVGERAPDLKVTATFCQGFVSETLVYLDEHVHNALPVDESADAIIDIVGRDVRECFVPEKDVLEGFRAQERLKNHYEGWSEWIPALLPVSQNAWFQKHPGIKNFVNVQQLNHWGVYELALCDPDKKLYVVYAGSSSCLYKRIEKYLAHGDHIAARLSPYLKLGCSVWVRWRQGKNWNRLADFEALESYMLATYDYAFNVKNNGNFRNVLDLDAKTPLLERLLNSRRGMLTAKSRVFQDILDKLQSLTLDEKRDLQPLLEKVMAERSVQK